MAPSRPYIVINDLLDATEVAKALVGIQVTFAYEHKGNHKFFFVDLGDAHDALDEIAHLNIQAFLFDK